MSHKPYSYEELLESSQGKLFGPDFAQLPAPNMLMMDRITSMITDGGSYNRGLVTAELDIKPDLWFFDCHFPGDPVMPGCLGLDAMWQLAGFFLSTMGLKGKGRALGVGEVRFTAQVLPTAKLVKYIIDVMVFMFPQLVNTGANSPAENKSEFIQGSGENNAAAL